MRVKWMYLLVAVCILEFPFPVVANTTNNNDQTFDIAIDLDGSSTIDKFSETNNDENTQPECLTDNRIPTSDEIEELRNRVSKLRSHNAELRQKLRSIPMKMDNSQFPTHLGDVATRLLEHTQNLMRNSIPDDQLQKIPEILTKNIPDGIFSTWETNHDKQQHIRTLQRKQFQKYTKQDSKNTQNHVRYQNQKQIATEIVREPLPPCSASFDMSSSDTWFDFTYPSICLFGKRLVIAVSSETNYNLLPTTIGSLRDELALIGLFSAGMSQTIPSQIGLLSNVLLFSGQNTLSGTFPSEIGNMKQVSYFLLGESQITGTLPSQFGQMMHLERFELRNVPLSGTIPTELAGRNFRWLFLHNCGLTGTIPSQIGLSYSYILLYVTYNQLTGSIPSEIGAVEPTDFKDLSLLSNRLTGSIPSQLGNLKFLTNLDLSRNKLSGMIPSDFGRLTRLRMLTLDQNQLSGTIPTQLSQLVSLQSLSLNHNKFSSSFIPSGVFSMAGPNLPVIECAYANLQDAECNPPPVYIHNAVFGVFVGIATVLCVVALSCVVVVFVFRTHPIITHTSWEFCAVVLVGCAMVCSGVPPYAVTLSDYSDTANLAACVAYPHLLSHGCQIVLGAIVIRHAYLLEDYGLFSHFGLVWKFVVAVIVIDVPVMISFSATEMTVPVLVSGCNYHWPNGLFATNIAVIASFMVAVAGFALATRNLPDDLRETKQINFSVMTLLTTIIAGVVVYQTGPLVEQAFIVNSSLILGFSVAMIAFVFVPKFKYIYKTGDVHVSASFGAREIELGAAKATASLAMATLTHKDDSSSASKQQSLSASGHSGSVGGGNQPQQPQQQQPTVIGKSYKRSTQKSANTQDSQKNMDL